ncbi:MAG: peptidoglycan DD-metalloendopeptidase family protein [Oscillospiraceae bacterium]|nr:peptidoglycan DD-metalloendopeptidase family protein [Oscillospiraceae bacterium]
MRTSTNTKQASKPGKRKLQHMSFYLVMLLCMAMVSIACWFAWTQTKNQMIVGLDSAINSAGDVKVMEMETAIPRNTIPESELETEPDSEQDSESENDSEIRSGARPRTDSETEPDSESEIPAGIQPLQTAPAETHAQPFTQSAAIIDAPQTAPVIILPDSQDSQEFQESQEITEEQTEAIFAPSTPSCYPLDGEIIETFSNGELVKSATTGVWQSHNGIDIAGTLGDAVCAMNSGIVESIENNALWGVTITIDHRNGIYSRYCNLNTGVTVNAGDKVEAGTIIGAVGDTADIESAMDTHLHFEVLRGEIYLDPVAYIQSTEETTAENAD